MMEGLLVAQNGDEDNVVAIRRGQDPDRDALVCPRCGGDLWVATVTIDRVTLRPTSVVGGHQPVIRCWTCGRGYDRHPGKDQHDQ